MNGDQVCAMAGEHLAMGHLLVGFVTLVMFSPLILAACALIAAERREHATGTKGGDK